MEELQPWGHWGFLPLPFPQAPPNLMSLSSSSFSGLSRMASRGRTRSSTPPSWTYCV